jgi:DNA/RNA endonuclease G (NUC1)
MRLNSWRGMLAALVGVTLLSCVDSMTAPKPKPNNRHIFTVDAAGVPKVVISQVYGAGGNASAVFRNDYVELFNAGTASADLASWSVQYASATGTGNFGVTNQIAGLTGTLAPGQYHLVKLASGGTNGAVLPIAADDSANINMAGGAGKVAVVHQATTLGCNGSSSPCDESQLGLIIDLVGYGVGSGGATFFEGTKAAPTISSTTADFRADDGCTDSNDNFADFKALTPSPRNSSNALAPCGGGGPVIGPLDHIVITGGTSVAAGSQITLSAELQDATNQMITDPLATVSWASADNATLQLVSTTGQTATFSGVVPGGPIAITVTAMSGGVTRSAAPPPAVTVTPAGTIVPSTTFVSEIHYDNVGTDAGEAIEIEGDAGSDLTGWSLVLYNGSPGSSTLGVYATVDLTGLTIPATCGGRGVVVQNFAVNGIQNGDADGWALVNPQGQVTELKSYEGTFTAVGGAAAGLTSTAIDANEATAPVVGRSVQRAGNGVWFGPELNTFGACNPALPPAPTGSVLVTSGKTDLAFAMQTQFFAKDLSGDSVKVVWSSSNTAIITVDHDGIVTGKGVGTAQLIATALDGAIGTADITIHIAPGSDGIRLGHNEEFGEPKDGNPDDDFLIHRPQYTVSYNPHRGGANWVSWNLDASHLGDNGRCPGTCYSADTALSNAGITAYTTADWVSNVDGPGSGYDRGHMAPSGDWTSSEADNNTTFFLSNFLPQRADLNQGPWEVLETALRDSVSTSHGSREAYIIAGGIFTNGVGLGSLLNLGKVGIPDSTWKIAVITPAGAGLNADGTLPPNTTVMAVNMPNVQLIKGNDWRIYLTTVSKIEHSTGYNFLSLIAESVQCRAEVRNCAPAAHITSGSNGQANEGQTVAFSGVTSTDPDQGDVLTMVWTVNGVNAGSGDALNYTFANDGAYEVGLTVTDNAGAQSFTSLNVSVHNVAPAISAFGGATLLPGESYSATGSFSDPGADSWTAQVNYGDGSGTSSLPLSGKSFTLSHAYTSTGTFTVVVSVSDGAMTSVRSATVVVESTALSIANLSAAVSALPLNNGQITSLQAKLKNAAKSLETDKTRNPDSDPERPDKIAGVKELNNFINEMQTNIRSGRISAAAGAPIVAYAQRLIESISAL